jgi:hypothetical protein
MASCRLSGADKKEKQRREQQQACGQQQTGLKGLCLCYGNGFGAAALHEYALVRLSIAVHNAPSRFSAQG